MRGDQEAKGILERHRLKPRRDIKLGNDAKSHKAGQHAQAEQCLNRHGVVSPVSWSVTGILGTSTDVRFTPSKRTSVECSGLNAPTQRRDGKSHRCIYLRRLPASRCTDRGPLSAPATETSAASQTISTVMATAKMYSVAVIGPLEQRAPYKADPEPRPVIFTWLRCRERET